MTEMQPAQKMPPIVKAKDINTLYGASHILHGINLSVRQGETVSLIGRNGMGKTTTIRSIFGLATPRSGHVYIRGRDMTGISPASIARQGLALVPENRGIFPNLTVLENLQMAARPGRNGRTDWDLDRVMHTFPRLHERQSNLGDRLSGGEQQMLTVGRALMTNPDLLILDEATEGLAPLIRKEIWSVVRKIKETGIASLIIDRDIKALLTISDRFVILSKGKVVWTGTTEELKQNEDLIHQHLGV